METATLQANGRTFTTLADGAEDAPLVVLAHGFPDDANTWNETRAHLAALGYRAVSPFMRGYAPSDLEGPYDSDALGADIAGWIEALGSGPAIVIGHDWGASASYAAAAQRPDLVRLLITLAIPHPASIKPSLSLAWAVRHFVTLRLPGAANRIRRGDLKHIDELWDRWSPKWNVPAEETESVKRTLRHPGSLEAAIAYYRHAGTISDSHKKKVEVPTVSFAGTDDILPVSAHEAARSRFNNTYEVVTLPGGHFVHREHPDAFHEKLTAVLTKHAPV